MILNFNIMAIFRERFGTCNSLFLILLYPAATQPPNILVLFSGHGVMLIRDSLHSSARSFQYYVVDMETVMVSLYTKVELSYVLKSPCTS